MSTLTKDGEVIHEISSFDAGVSPTASSAERPLYGSSGSMRYHVVMKGGASCVVDAATGDEAATLALAKFPGGFVVSINPATQAR